MPILFCQVVGEVLLFPTASNYNINLPSCLKDFIICGSKCSEYLKTNADIYLNIFKSAIRGYSVSVLIILRLDCFSKDFDQKFLRKFHLELSLQGGFIDALYMHAVVYITFFVTCCTCTLSVISYSNKLYMLRCFSSSQYPLNQLSGEVGRMLMLQFAEFMFSGSKYRKVCILTFNTSTHTVVQ